MMIFAATATDMYLFHKACERWGITSQIYKTIEETAELNIELTKALLDGSPGQETTADEIADVYIMLHQLAYGLGINEIVNRRVQYKMERLVHLVS